jgi:uncharacterized protein (TIGR00369 family)
MENAMSGAPQGFEPVRSGGEFIEVNGPLWLKAADGKVQLGMRVEPRHTNGMLICHGGMIASFCDMLMPLAARRLADGLEATFLPTISLQVDYLASVPVGAWLEGEAQVLRTTRNMVFMQATVTADGELAVRASAILKVGKRIADREAHG